MGGGLKFNIMKRDNMEFKNFEISDNCRGKTFIEFRTFLVLYSVGVQNGNDHKFSESILMTRQFSKLFAELYIIYICLLCVVSQMAIDPTQKEPYYGKNKMGILVRMVRIWSLYNKWFQIYKISLKKVIPNDQTFETIIEINEKFW